MLSKNTKASYKLEFAWPRLRAGYTLKQLLLPYLFDLEKTNLLTTLTLLKIFPHFSYPHRSQTMKLHSPSKTLFDISLFGILDFSPAWASLVAQIVKNLHAMLEMQVRSLGQEGPLEKEMATHSSILAWRIPRTKESGWLQSLASQRVDHDWATNTLSFTLLSICHSLIFLNINFHFFCCNSSSLLLLLSLPFSDYPHLTNSTDIILRVWFLYLHNKFMRWELLLFSLYLWKYGEIK